MSFNVTAAAHYPSADQVYSNTDFSSLNWLEKQWAGWYILIGNPVIATGLMSFLLHEVRFQFFFCLLLVNCLAHATSFFAGSLSTSAVAFPGSSSTLFLTSASGSCNLARFLPLKRNGNARSRSYSHISLLSCQRYVSRLSRSRALSLI